MLLQLQKYELEVAYKPSKELYFADTLSRAYLPSVSSHLLKLDVPQAEEGYFIRTVEHINVTEHLPITSERSTEIQQKTKGDESLQKLKHVIQGSWPESKELLPPEIRSYSQFKEEISKQDGILFDDNCVIIPTLSLFSFQIHILVVLLRLNLVAGISDTLMSNNAPQFVLDEFKKFASEWQFDHDTSSPNYQQSNGKIENAEKKLSKRQI